MTQCPQRRMFACGSALRWRSSASWASLNQSLRPLLTCRHLATALQPVAAMPANENKVVVLWPGGEQFMDITVQSAAVQRNMKRDPAEPLDRCLERLRTNMAPKAKKKRKDRRRDAADAPAPAATPTAELFTDATCATPISGNTRNAEAWRAPAALRIGEAVCRVCRNPATVTTLQLHTQPMAGHPVVATAELQFSDVENCAWEWRRLPAAAVSTAAGQAQATSSSAGGGSETAGRDASAAGEPVVVGRERTYVPCTEDVGSRLEVECTPTGVDGPGEPSSVRSSEPVWPEPAEALTCFERPLPPLPPPRFRILTYNLLADQYASQEYSKRVLFAHTPEPLLDIWLRCQRVLRQLLHSGADVCCLQEVDRKIFERYLQPHLATAGFQGVYTNKAGRVSEGSATFFRTSRFELIATRDIDLRELYKARPLSPRLRHFEPMLRASHGLAHSLKRVTTIAQALLLAPRGHKGAGQVAEAGGGVALGGRESATDESGMLLIANTHLFFHGAAPHIRSMHVAALIGEAAALARDTLPPSDQPPAAAPPTAASTRAGAGLPPGCAFVFCGDLNSDLNDGMPGVVRMLQEGRLEASHWDWAAGADFDFRETRSRPARTQALQDAKSRDPFTPQPLAETGSDSSSGSLSDDADAAAAGGTHAAGAARRSSGGGSAVAALPPPPTEAADTPVNTKRIAVTGVEVTLPCAFATSHDIATQRMTNVVPGFEGVLDYIWCQRGRVRVAMAHPVPDKPELGGYLPNARNPSDHLPVVADLELVSATGAGGDDNQQGGEIPSEALAAQSPRSAAAPASAPAAAPGAAEHARAQATAGADAAQRRGTVLPAHASSIGEATRLLRAGEVIALPTDTLYGLAGLVSSPRPIDAIYAIKGRARGVPLAVCVAAVADVPAFGRCEHLPTGLLPALLPGPVTVVLQRRGGAPTAANLNLGVDTVAIRVPDSGFVGGVCQEVGVGIVLTSANRSGAASSVAAGDFEELWGHVAAVFDGGVIAGDLRGSTIVDLSSADGYKVLRDGSALEATEATLAEHGLRHL